MIDPNSGEITLPVENYPIWGTCTIPAGQQYCIETLNGPDPAEQLYNSYTPCSWTINGEKKKPHKNWSTENKLTGIRVGLAIGPNQSGDRVPNHVFINTEPIDNYENNIGHSFTYTITADTNNIYVFGAEFMDDSISSVNHEELGFQDIFTYDNLQITNIKNPSAYDLYNIKKYSDEISQNRSIETPSLDSLYDSYKRLSNLYQK